MIMEDKDIKQNQDNVPEENVGDISQDTVQDQETAAQEEVQQEDEAVKALEARVAEVNDKYIRLAAEFDNYRRRTARERLDLIATAGEDIIKGMLPVLDDC